MYIRHVFHDIPVILGITIGLTIFVKTVIEYCFLSPLSGKPNMPAQTSSTFFILRNLDEWLATHNLL